MEPAWATHTERPRAAEEAAGREDATRATGQTAVYTMFLMAGKARRATAGRVRPDILAAPPGRHPGRQGQRVSVMCS